MERAATALELTSLAARSCFQDMVGESAGLREIFRQIDTVADTGCTVLLLGETGTGKELVAKAIHARSKRARSPFVKLDCSAVQSSLVESELFGHEKGAFTGAIARRAGRFETAADGTLFLDEIGELPLEIQPKLLRVLQEREYERLGSCRTLRTDARLVAATHRDLETMCAFGCFREDLFYRLNVFPIRLPALRERREDIPLLVSAFVPRIARRLNREIRSVERSSMEALCRHHWPGNVRELHNVLERAVILASGPVLEVSLGPPRAAIPESTTLEEVSRAHILAVLASTNGIVAGPSGAAARLGMKRTTLNFRMKKLGISRREPVLLRASND